MVKSTTGTVHRAMNGKTSCGLSVADTWSRHRPVQPIKHVFDACSNCRWWGYLETYGEVLSVCSECDEVLDRPRHGRHVHVREVGL